MSNNEHMKERALQDEKTRSDVRNMSCSHFDEELGNAVGTYNSARYVVQANHLNDASVLFYTLNEGIDYEPSIDEKGGIFVLSTDVNAVQLDDRRLVNWIKQHIATIVNRVTSTKKIDEIAQAYNLVGWTIGHYFNGRYTVKTDGPLERTLSQLR